MSMDALGGQNSTFSYPLPCMRFSACGVVYPPAASTTQFLTHSPSHTRTHALQVPRSRYSTRIDTWCVVSRLSQGRQAPDPSQSNARAGRYRSHGSCYAHCAPSQWKQTPPPFPHVIHLVQSIPPFSLPPRLPLFALVLLASCTATIRSYILVLYPLRAPLSSVPPLFLACFLSDSHFLSVSAPVPSVLPRFAIRHLFFH